MFTSCRVSNNVDPYGFFPARLIYTTGSQGQKVETPSWGKEEPPSWESLEITDEHRFSLTKASLEKLEKKVKSANAKEKFQQEDTKDVEKLKIMASDPEKLKNKKTREKFFGNLEERLTIIATLLIQSGATPKEQWVGPESSISDTISKVYNKRADLQITIGGSPQALLPQQGDVLKLAWGMKTHAIAEVQADWQTLESELKKNITAATITAGIVQSTVQGQTPAELPPDAPKEEQTLWKNFKEKLSNMSPDTKGLLAATAVVGAFILFKWIWNRKGGNKDSMSGWGWSATAIAAGAFAGLWMSGSLEKADFLQELMKKYDLTMAKAKEVMEMMKKRDIKGLKAFFGSRFKEFTRFAKEHLPFGLGETEEESQEKKEDDPDTMSLKEYFNERIKAPLEQAMLPTLSFLKTHQLEGIAASEVLAYKFPGLAKFVVKTSAGLTFDAIRLAKDAVLFPVKHPLWTFLLAMVYIGGDVAVDNIRIPRDKQKLQDKLAAITVDNKPLVPQDELRLTASLMVNPEAEMKNLVDKHGGIAGLQESLKKACLEAYEKVKQEMREQNRNDVIILSANRKGLEFLKVALETHEDPAKKQSELFKMLQQLAEQGYGLTTANVDELIRVAPTAGVQIKRGEELPYMLWKWPDAETDGKEKWYRLAMNPEGSAEEKANYARTMVPDPESIGTWMTEVWGSNARHGYELGSRALEYGEDVVKTLMSAWKAGTQFPKAVVSILMAYHQRDVKAAFTDTEVLELCGALVKLVKDGCVVTGGGVSYFWAGAKEKNLYLPARFLRAILKTFGNEGRGQDAVAEVGGSLLPLTVFGVASALVQKIALGRPIGAISGGKIAAFSAIGPIHTFWDGSKMLRAYGVTEGIQQMVMRPLSYGFEFTSRVTRFVPIARHSEFAQRHFLYQARFLIESLEWKRKGPEELDRFHKMLQGGGSPELAGLRIELDTLLFELKNAKSKGAKDIEEFFKKAGPIVARVIKKKELEMSVLVPLRAVGSTARVAGGVIKWTAEKIHSILTPLLKKIKDLPLVEKLKALGAAGIALDMLFAYLNAMEEGERAELFKDHPDLADLYSDKAKASWAEGIILSAAQAYYAVPGAIAGAKAVAAGAGIKATLVGVGTGAASAITAAAVPLTAITATVMTGTELYRSFKEAQAEVKKGTADHYRTQFVWAVKELGYEEKLKESEGLSDAEQQRLTQLIEDKLLHELYTTGVDTSATESWAHAASGIGSGVFGDKSITTTKLSEEREYTVKEIMAALYLNTHMGTAASKSSSATEVVSHLESQAEFQYQVKYMALQNTVSSFMEARRLYERSKSFAEIMNNRNQVLELETAKGRMERLDLSKPEFDADNITASSIEKVFRAGLRKDYLEKESKESKAEPEKLNPPSAQVAALYAVAKEFGYSGRPTEEELRQFFDAAHASIFGIYWHEGWGRDGWSGYDHFGLDQYYGSTIEEAVPSLISTWESESFIPFASRHDAAFSDTVEVDFKNEPSWSGERDDIIRRKDQKMHLVSKMKQAMSAFEAANKKAA